jgi:flavin reductase (DIM6/NTAB) family NADH-FMN oxidoreductase RutF
MSFDITTLCKSITCGVYVIAVRDAEIRNAFTAAWVMQVSFDPVLIAFSINPKHYSYRLLKAGGICSINALGKHQLHLAEHFGIDRLANKMAKCQWQQAKSGAPILSEALVYFDCSVSHYCEAGDHQLVVCKVLEAGALNDGVVMLYTDTEDMDGSGESFGDLTN